MAAAAPVAVAQFLRRDAGPWAMPFSAPHASADSVARPASGSCACAFNLSEGRVQCVDPAEGPTWRWGERGQQWSRIAGTASVVITGIYWKLLEHCKRRSPIAARRGPDGNAPELHTTEAVTRRSKPVGPGLQSIWVKRAVMLERVDRDAQADPRSVSRHAGSSMRPTSTKLAITGNYGRAIVCCT